jgi:hypothetical protein
MSGEYFTVIGHRNNFEIRDYGCHAMRNSTTLQVMMEAIIHFDLNQHIAIGVCTGDSGPHSPFHARPAIFHSLKNVAYSSDNGDYSHVCPDFLFGGEPTQNVRDWDKTCNAVTAAGQTESDIKKIGWVGSIGNVGVRHNLFQLGQQHQNIMDIKDVHWTNYDTNLERWTGANYVTYEQYAKRWEYLIDVEGVGYSTRGKLLMHAGRVLFWADRPYKEWYVEQMQPWVHYVPVRRDLGDLVENFERVESDLALKQSIQENGLQFAKTNLRYMSAMNRWRDILA